MVDHIDEMAEGRGGSRNGHEAIVLLSLLYKIFNFSK